MMFTEASLLDVWEAAHGLGAVRRALALAVAGGAEPGEVGDLAVGRRDEFLLALRERCFGTAFPCLVSCPSCGEELELELSSRDLRPSQVDAAAIVAVDGYEVEFRAVTSRDLLEVHSRRALLERCVVTARMGDQEVERSELPDAVLGALPDALAAGDPQADVRIDLDCAVCGHRWASPFDIAVYLWTELEACARRLLYDVHALALAYGWSEAEVLAVSPGRRRRYLELAGTMA
ncbi:hypothetical protein ACFXPA_10815 [Amycolatopsis sp. NPDC059090]|uniref:T4 family baseplate hub assembly chaperone n=1 Tax=unclassified Amycolatopsis TaxID=2618356 RepID=UPI0036704960